MIIMAKASPRGEREGGRGGGAIGGEASMLSKPRSRALRRVSAFRCAYGNFAQLRCCYMQIEEMQNRERCTRER